MEMLSKKILYLYKCNTELKEQNKDYKKHFKLLSDKITKLETETSREVTLKLELNSH